MNSESDKPVGRPVPVAREGWIALSIATLVGAMIVGFLAFFFFTFQFENDDGGRTVEGVFLALALAGLVAALGMLARSIDGRGHPGRWFTAALILCSPYPVLLFVLAL